MSASVKFAQSVWPELATATAAVTGSKQTYQFGGTSLTFQYWFSRVPMKHLLVFLALGTPVLVSAAELTISCVGPESDNCPVKVEAKLSDERLLAYLQFPKPAGGTEGVLFGWCGTQSSGGFSSPGGWSRDSTGCKGTGVFQVINGEFTKRQLADSYIVFESRKTEGFCGGDKAPLCQIYPR